MEVSSTLRWILFIPAATLAAFFVSMLAVVWTYGQGDPAPVLSVSANFMAGMAYMWAGTEVAPRSGPEIAAKILLWLGIGISVLGILFAIEDGSGVYLFQSIAFIAGILVFRYT